MTVSVIIPVYNDETTIARALDSVAAQTHPPLEVLIVDDASEPTSREKLNNIVASHEVRFVVRILDGSSNRGPSAARNFGWQSARGTWIAFLDADDSWMPAKLESQLRYLVEAPEVDLLGTRFLVSPPSHITKARSVYPGTATRISLRRQLARNNFGTSSIHVRSSIADRFDESFRFAEDYDLWCRLLASGHVGAILEDALAIAYKPFFGAGGASARLWRMQLGGLRALAGLHRRGDISTPQFVAFSAISLLRFVRRVLITTGRSVKAVLVATRLHQPDIEP